MASRLSALDGKFTQIKKPGRDAVSDTAPVEKTVKEIIANVRERGDAAVREYSAAFDKVELEKFEVSQEERLKAVAELDPQTREDTEFAIANVRAFAEAQLKTILPLEIETLPGLHLRPPCHSDRNRGLLRTRRSLSPPVRSGHDHRAGQSRRLRSGHRLPPAECTSCNDCRLPSVRR